MGKSQAKTNYWQKYSWFTNKSFRWL